MLIYVVFYESAQVNFVLKKIYEQFKTKNHFKITGFRFYYTKIHVNFIYLKFPYCIVLYCFNE